MIAELGHTVRFGAMELMRELERVAHEVGFAGLGITGAEPFPEVGETIQARRDAGQHAKLHFTYAAPERATDVGASVPWAVRLLVASMPYLPAAGSPQASISSSPSGRIARFAVGQPYARLRHGLSEMASVLAGSGYRTEILADDNRLVDRAAAVRAGVGWWGKNTMVLDPRHGPWLLLGSIATDAMLDRTDPMVRDCGTCEACVPACPTGALVAPGVLDARLCLAAWAQAPGDIPEEMRAPMGDRIYGCDDCLEACPPGARLLSEATRRRGRVDLRRLLEVSDVELLEDHGHFYIPRRDPDYIRRNALVAVGNVGSEDDLGVLAGFLSHPSPMLVRHAVWAIARIGGVIAEKVLEEHQR